MRERAVQVNEQVDRLRSHPVVELAKPEFMGEGGEHIVFSLGDHPEVVAKVDRDAIIHALRNREVEPAQIESDLHRERTAIEQMREYFGEAVLKEQPVFMTVPLDTKALHAIIGDEHPDLPEGIQEIPALVRLQDRLPERPKGTHDLSPRFRYLEIQRQGISTEEYERFLTIDEKNAEDYLKGMCPNFFAALHKEPRDDKLIRVVRDFVGKTSSYVRETGEMLDLAGPGNIVFLHDQDREGKDQWRLLMPDARYPARGRWDQAHEAMDVFIRAGALPKDSANFVMNALNFQRFMNAVAIVVGAPERLSLTRESLAGRGAELLAKIREAHRREA